MRVLLPFAACLSPLAACVAPAPDVDFSGVGLFWGVAETLEADGSPTDAAWEALFATPGYATMAAHDGSDRMLRETLPLALRPSLAPERAGLAEDDYRAIVVEHLRLAVERRGELEAFRRRLAGRDLAGEALGLARSWLPPEAPGAPGANGTGAPPISFVLLEPDARGYERIVIDLALARDLGDGLVPMIAHEAHHVLREAVHVVARPRPERPEDDLFAALDNLQAEGVADQIDKRDYLAGKTWGPEPSQRLWARMHARFVEAHRSADESLARMDRLLAAYARDPHDPRDPGTARELGRELRDSLVLGGHPVGFYMAGAILEAFGRERLIERVGDPFAFVEDYSAAAARLGGGRHVFGAEALAGVARLRDVYAKAATVGN